ncbi:efflux RND transporter periplasmic adaptor subunit [Dokdonella sp.]|uniref:efflux RND transporter periplasmic adaptor subunit n=1 Tax=Dokdonella sp. TaxID=2291710 RepID=UPI0035279669
MDSRCRCQSAAGLDRQAPVEGAVQRPHRHHQPDARQLCKSGRSVVTLQRLDPVLVDLNVPQDKLGEIKTGQAVVLSLDSFPDHPFLGEVTAISPKLDPATRNAQVEASVPNPEELLKPGMFARVAVQVGEQEILSDPAAVGDYLQSVWRNRFPGQAIDRQGRGRQVNLPSAQSVFVTTGAKRGDQINVLSGIKGRR